MKFRCSECGFEIKNVVYPVLCRCGVRWTQDGGIMSRGKFRYPMRGFGDLVARVLKWFGFTKPCAGCGRRQEKLNRWWGW